MPRGSRRGANKAGAGQTHADRFSESFRRALHRSGFDSYPRTLPAMGRPDRRVALMSPGPATSHPQARPGTARCPVTGSPGAAPPACPSPPTLPPRPWESPLRIPVTPPHTLPQHARAGQPPSPRPAPLA